jgi:uncharacterized RDD family membrane protein YckC
MSQPEQIETGPYYSRADYAGLFRRFTIIFVDLSVVVLVWVAIVLSQGGEPTRTAIGIWVGVSYGYLVLLERSFGTLGFLLTGVKILTLKGDRPSILRMTFRLLLWVFGPINALFDIYWLTGDEYRQTLRDKLAGTVVVRTSAVPAGTGEIRLNRYQLMGYSFVFYEVRKPAGPPVKAT